MEKIKQDSGVTLLMLTIIVLVLFIITAVSINTGLFDLSATTDSRLEGELGMVQYAVLQQYVKYKTTLDSNYLLGTDFNDQMQSFKSTNYSTVSLVHNISNNDENYQRYYKISPSDLITLGIQDSQYSYIVNYYTGEVFNADVYTTSVGTTLYIRGKVEEN